MTGVQTCALPIYQKCFDVAKKLESSVYDVVKDGVKTKDIGGNKTTMEFTQHVISKLV